MADYSQGSWEQQTTNPAAPEGLRQRAAQNQSGSLQTWGADPYAGNTSSWFFGRNNAGINNGWSNDFTNKMFESYDAWTKKVYDSQSEKDPAKRLTMYDQFDPQRNPGANGLALWDDPGGRFKVGDVIQNGRVVPGQNVREVYGDDTANLIMGKFMFGAKEQQKFSADSDPSFKWGEEVKKRTDEWTKAAAAAPTARQYQADVEREQQDWLDSSAPEAFAAGSGIAAAGMAAAGAVALGSSWTGPGALLAGGAAFIVGAGAAWLNQDQITEQMARATVQADRAKARYGGDVAFSSKVANWNGVLLRSISPLSNTVQGVYDTTHGAVGDGESEFYHVNAEGERTASGWWQAGDIAASLGDSVLQFSSGAGIKAYMGFTGGLVAGQVGTMALTGARSDSKSAGFNERTGEWDEYEGMEFVKAVGAVGIDALQFGIAGGISRAATKSQQAFNLEKAGTGDFAPQTINAMKFKFDNVTGEAVSHRVALSTILVPSEALQWAATTWRARSQVLQSARAGSGPVVGGMPAKTANRYVDPTIAQRAEMAKGVYMPGSDDYYRAAIEISRGSSFSTALINGFAEGWEEAVQAILEPGSFGEQVRAQDVVSAYLYGLASGTGMAMGHKTQRATSAQQEEYRAKAAFMMRRGLNSMPKEDWNKIWAAADKQERQRMAILNPMEAKRINEVQKVLKELHVMDNQLGSSIPVAAINAQRTVKYNELMANRVDKEEFRVLMPMGGGLVIGKNGQVDTTQWGPDEAVQSAYQVMQDLEMIWGGLQAQQTALEELIEKTTEKTTELTNILNTLTDPQQKANLQAQLDHAERQLVMFKDDLLSFQGQVPVTKAISDAITEAYTLYTEEIDPIKGKALLDDFNELITLAYEGRWIDLENGKPFSAKWQEQARRAVELRLARDPKQSSESWLIMKPQASQVLSKLNQHHTTFMNQSRLKALNADHDGDQGVSQTRMYIPPDELKQLRRGAQYNRTITEEVPIFVKDDQGVVQENPDGSPMVKGTYKTSRKTVMIDPADGHKALIDMYSDAYHDLADPFRKSIVNRELLFLANKLYHKYTREYPIFTRAQLTPILQEFFHETTNYGHDAEQHLLDAMVNLDETAMLELADITNMPEVIWIKREIEIAYERIQTSLSLNGAMNQTPQSSGAPQTLPEEHAFQVEHAVEEAATDGLTLSMMLEYTTDPVRQSQDLFYSPFYRASVESMRLNAEGHLDPAALEQYIQTFNALGSGVTQAVVTDVANKNPIEDRVVRWLNEHLQYARSANPTLTSLQGPGALILLANLEVVDIDTTNINEYKILNNTTTLLQLLLKRSIAIEEHVQRMAPEDAPIKKKITKLKYLTHAGDKHSKTANRALMEVFQDVPMYRIVGRWADAFGGQLTPRQLKMTVAGLNKAERKEQFGKWRRATGYRSEGLQKPKHDPPYSITEYGDGTGDINGFTMLIDGIIATAQTDPLDLERADNATSDQFKTWHYWFQEQRAEWELAHSERLGREWAAMGNSGRFSDAFVIKDMIERLEFLPTQIASMLPADATTAIFKFKDGKVWSARWLQEMLTIKDADKAELMLFLHGKFAMLNAHQGRLKLDMDTEKVRKEEKKEGKKRTELTPPALINEVNPADLQSRFLQVIVKVMQNDPTGFELDQILRLAERSKSLDAFLKEFNAQPNWNGTRTPLLKYHDDVALFEPSTADVWSSGLPSQLQRDAIEAASNKLALFTPLYAEARAQHVSETNFIREMKAALKNDPNAKTHAHQWLNKLRQAISNAQMFGDQLGYAARDQFLAMVQEGNPHLQNKGLPDPHAEAIGTNQITNQTIGGFRSGFSQELSAMTSEDWDNVKTNLTGMIDGPVRIQLDNGKFLELDMSSDAAVLDMLENPITRAFAWAVVFPTVRDVDKNNNVQHYRRISSAEVDGDAAGLKQALNDATLNHLGPTNPSGRLTLKQANEFIALMDAGIIRKAQKGSAAERQALLEWGNQPMVAMLSEYLAAYTHGPGFESVDKEAMRRELIIDLATVLMHSARLKDGDLNRVKTLSQALLQAKYAGNRTQLDLMGMNPLLLQGMEAQLEDIVRKDFEARIDRINQDVSAQLQQKVRQQKGLPNTYDPKEEDRLKLEGAELQKRAEIFKKHTTLADKLSALPPSVQGAIDMWTTNINVVDLDTVDKTDPDQVVQLSNLASSRLALLEYLNTNERITRFVEKGGPALMHKVRLALKDNPMDVVTSNIIRPEQWMQLAIFAGTAAIAESGAKVSSGVGLRALKLEGEADNLRRYYDRSYSYLLDGLFDTMIREMAYEITERAEYRPPDMSADKVFKEIHNTLLSDKKLGIWTDLAVGEAVKARIALLNSTVLGAIQRHGISPPQWRDVIGASWATFTPPRPEDISTAKIVMPHTNANPGMFIEAAGNLALKLEHHFVNEVNVTTPGGGTISVLFETTTEYPKDTVVATGFKVFRSDLMQQQLEKMKEIHGEGNYTIDISYVDVDKKPYTPEYVNSIYYDGSGRMGASTMAPGPVADTIFGNGAINKQGQQTPLDAATKAGAAFWQLVTTSLNQVKQIEADLGKLPLAVLLHKKSLEMLLMDYETGVMALGDNNTIYKLMKMRHVVQGKDAEGKTIRLWAEDVISRETNGESLPFVGDYELVPLSENVHISILGRSGERGTKSALTMPELNPKEINTFPRLDDAWLEQIGLSDLGGKADIFNNYALATVGYLAPATMQTDGRGVVEDEKYEQQVLLWQGEEQRIIGDRAAVAEQLKITGQAGSRQANRNRLQQMMRGERKASILSALGVPLAEMVDLAAVPIADLLEKELDALIGDSTVRMIWVHDVSPNVSPDPTKAILGRASINNNFENVRVGKHKVSPMYKDVVVIDLDSIYEINDKNFHEALKEAKQTVKAYADRGVYVVLGGVAASDLRGTVANWLLTEETIYRPMAHGSHVFAPKRLAPGSSRVVQAMESKLLEHRVYTAEEIELWMIDDRFGRYVSENGVLLDYQHLDQLRDRRIQGVLLPTQISDIKGGNTLYGLPVRGEGEYDQWRELQETLLPIIDQQEVQDHLFNLSGGNPEGIAIYKELPNGDIQDGVLDFYEALERFRNHLRNGTDPIAIGQTLMAGDFYVALSPTKTPLLMRYGFQLPKTERLQEQLATPVGEKKPVDGMRGLGIGISINKLQDQQTVPPPMLIRKVEGSKDGVRVVGEYELSVMSKGMLQGIAYKAGFRAMPPNLAFPQEAMSDNGFRILAGATAQSFESKQGRRDIIVNYRKAFALAGIDLREFMMEFFYGKKDRSDPAVFDEDWSKTMRILEIWSKQSPALTTSQARSMLSTNSMLAYAQQEINFIAQTMDPGWTKIDFVARNENSPGDPINWIAACILATLAAPGMEVKHVVGTQGLLTLKSRLGRAQVAELPPLLTEALANPAHPEVSELLINAMNNSVSSVTKQRLDANNNPEFDADGNPVMVPIYRMNPDFTFNVLMRDPETGRDHLWENTEIAMVVPLSYDKDATTVSAASLEAKSNVSPHNVAVAAEALSAWTAIDPQPEGSVSDLEALFGNNKVIYFEDDTGSFYDIFGNVKASLGHVDNWNRRLPGQQAYIQDALKKRLGYEVAIDKSGWKEPDRDRADAAALKLLHKLNLPDEHLAEVDTLVRQFLGRPGNAEQEGADLIDASTYASAVDLMFGNVKDNIHPLEGGDVPLESETFWALVYRANLGKKNAWAPVSKQRKKVKQSAESWEAWVDTLFGQLLNSQSPFHAMFGKDLDGFYHTYQGTTPTYLTMPLSMDTQVDLLLADKDLNEYFLSLDQGTNALWASPQLLDIMTFTLDQVTGHADAEMRLNDARETPSHSFAEQIARKKAWLEKQQLPRQNPLTVMDHAKTGATYQESGRNTHNFIVNLNHLQIMNRLFDPSLLASAFIEVPVRNALEHATDIVMGTHLSAGGKLISRGAEAATKAVNAGIGLANKVEGVDLPFKPDFTPKYTPEQIQMFRLLAVDLGSKTEWRAELFSEMMYKPGLIKEGQGWFGKKAEKGATAVVRMTSDPQMGMLARSAALRYLTSAFDYIENVDGSMSVEQFVVNMRDPMWLKKNLPRAHQLGVNSVASVRGTRQRWINKSAFGWIDRLEKGSPSAQWLGFLIGVPFKFRRFNLGTFLTITGLDGFDQMFAMMRDARPDNGIVGRLQAAMRGEPYVPKGYVDHSDVLESIDLVRPFVKGGLTQTGLMVAAMWAGSLDLGGEDDEAKRRRRMAQYLNGPLLLDPRRAENDMLYADAIFLDSMPFGIGNLFKDEETGRSAILPHWIFRQFTSPMMGIQRFLSTGDTREIFWGFQDAVSVIPYSVLNMWDDASTTFALLNKEAELKIAENPNDADAHAAAAGLGITMVSVLEKALFENRFVNAVRNASDKYDRDPFVMPGLTPEGNIARGPDGLPLSTDALVSYVDESGDTKQAYQKRPESGIQGALSHGYAENNLTYALLASLFTGQFRPGQSTFKRSNMAVKERSVELPETTKAQAEALILSAYMSTGGQAELTEDEIRRALKHRSEQAGVTWEQEAIEAQAKAIFASQTGIGALSLLDAEGNEVITKAGAYSVYQSLWDGMVEWEDASLEGMFIPWEMRDEIAAEWLEELTQEGIDLGLGEEAAFYRTKRLWYGDQANPLVPGLQSILYDNRIPGDGTVKYRQLNMTYMIGPDGNPVATPFTRQNLWQAFGIPVPTLTPAAGPGMSKDELGKSVDDVLGINTGLHGLERLPFEKHEPPKDLLDKVFAKDYSPSGYNKFPSRRYGGGGGGGGYFQRMQPLPSGTAPRMDDIPMINTSAPYIRRARVERERVTSDRGRLKQWQ